MTKHFHPFDIFINETSKHLIVGTLPPYRFCTKELKINDVDFCYGSQDGLFWPLLEKVYNRTFLYNHSQEAILQRKEILLKNALGICDIVASCKREKIDASDLGMKDLVLRDILKTIKKYKNVQTLLFTGGASKNGPEYFLRQVLKKQNIQYTCINNQSPKIHEFFFDNRKITTYSLISPSNAANRSIGANKYYKEQKKINEKYNTFDYRVEQYKKVFSLI